MNEIQKSTFREIKSSFGRFLAIFAIIALGVGFFAGLKVSKDAMQTTAKEYLDRHAFYDFRLLSTLGFEEEDVAFLREEAAAAEGSVSLDFLYLLENGTQGALKALSLTETVNTVELVCGRLPEADDECVADSALFGEGALGSVIYLAEDNDEDTADSFTHQAYTVVGTVQSPLYIQYERGNTSLGTGRLSGFIYLLPQGFDTEYYTEIYVRFDQDHSLYGDDYADFIDEKEILWEDLTARAADGRYRRLLADAEDELADARQEFTEKKAEGEEELADAEEELSKARDEIADGEEKLADAEEELADARKTLREKEKELEDGRQTLAEKERELADAEAELARGEQQWKDGKAQADSGRSSLSAQKSRLQQEKAELEEQAAQLEAQAAPLEAQAALKAQLEAGIAQLEAGIAQASAGIAQAEAGIVQAQTRAAELREQIAQLKSEGKDTTQADEELQSVEAAKANAEAIKTEAEAQKQQLEAQKRQLEPQKQQMDAVWPQLEAALQQLEPYRQQIAAGRQTIASYESQIAGAEQELGRAERELAEGRAELDEAARQIAEGRQAIEEARTELADGEKALADAKRELADAEETVAENRETLAEAKEELADGQKEYEDALEEFDREIADAEEELADAEEELADFGKPDTYVLGRDTNIGYVCFENDSNIVAGIANIFPVFFFLVAALVCITTMNRMVEEQRTQIGVLKALGYGNGAIMGKYLTYSGLAAVLGCVFGFLLGTWAFPQIFWIVYKIMYKAGEMHYLFDWKLAVISLAVALLCSIGTTWLSCRVELGRNAAALMRPKAPKAGKRVFLERIPFVWKRLSFLRKVSVRNIFRYKKRLFMMVLGISGCTALLVTGFGINDTIADVAGQQFREVQIFDMSVSFKEPADRKTEEELGELSGEGLADYLCVMEKNMDIVTARGVKSIYLAVADGERISAYVDMHTRAGEKIDYPGPGQGVITRKLSEEYGLNVGDTVMLRDEDMRSLTVTISGVMENYIYNYVYISDETWRAATGEEPERKTAYLNLAEGADAHLLSAELMNREEVASVSVNADMAERVGSMLERLNVIVVVVIICAAGLAFIVLYNLTNINITERIREIATVKVLGFFKKETASYVFRENILLTVFGMVLGLFLGRLLHWFVIDQIRVDMISFDIHVEPISYLYSALLTLVFAWLVDKTMEGRLEKISMTESLKSVD
ncbi:MAG: FtsX-like permease family protein [bacterium]|nr:FtsX-like permease family protein [bacterium]